MALAGRLPGAQGEPFDTLRRGPARPETAEPNGDNLWLTPTPSGCHAGRVSTSQRSQDETIERLHVVRAQAIEHTRRARELAAERRDLMQQLIRDGWSQSDIARQLGVTRQAIQKMLSL
jgi:DNA-binding XRE family transcriptional regulator